MAMGSSRKIDASDDALPTPRAPRRRRKVWGLAVLLGGLLLLVGFAPPLIAHSPLRNWLLGKAVAPEQGSLTSSGASLGWFSAPVIEGLEVRDAQGELILAAPTIRVSQSLFNLITNSSNLGTVQIEAPELYAKLRPDGSNVEDFIAPWLAGESSEPAQIALVLELANGKVHIDDQAAGQKWDLTDLKTRLALSTLTPTPTTVQASATVAGQPAPSTLHVDLTLPATAAGDTAAAPNQAKLQTDRFPLPLVQTLLARAVPDARLAGQLTTQMQCEWSAGDQVALDGDLLVQDFKLQARALGGDELNFARLRVPCRLAYADQLLTIENLAAECDLGQLNAQGGLNLAGAAGGKLAAQLARQPFQLRGRVDLVKLANMLPNTFHLRDGVRLTSGEIEIGLDSRNDGSTHRWQGHVSAQRLAALNGEKPIVWDRPIDIVLDAHQLGEEIIVDRATCESDFLQITAGGTPSKLTARATCDLNALVDQLEQLVDFGGWQLSGFGEGELQWTTSPNGAFQAAAKLDLKNFQVSGPDRPAWIEEHLQLQAQAAGGLLQGRLAKLDTATLDVNAAEDRLKARLREAVAPIEPQTAWPLSIELAGELARWLPRLQPFVTLPELRLAGGCDLNATLDYAPEQVRIQKFQADLRQFAFTGYGLYINEPRMQLEGEGQWDAAAARFEAPNFTLASTALSLRAEQVSVHQPADAAPVLAGTIAVQGTLDRLQRWFEDPQQPSPYRLAGAFNGNAQVNRQADETTAQIRLNGSQLKLVETTAGAAGAPATSRLVWSEPQAALALSGVHRAAADQLKLEQLQLTSQTLGLQGAGTIDKLRTEQQLKVAGTLSYQMAQLMTLLEPYTGKGVSLAGAGSTPFQIEGPLGLASSEPLAHWSRRLKGSAGIGWQSGTIYGMPLGPANLEAVLGQGAVAVTPFKVAISEGQFSSAPTVRFDPEPAVLTLPAGPMLEQVRISPEMCDRGLKYIAPILADATRTNGKFSLSLEGGRVPLADPKKSDLAGRMTIHSVDVLPGPLAQEILLFAKQIEAIVNRQPPPVSLQASNTPLLKLENQNVDFRLVEGRVYHRNLEINAGEVVIRTHGSVGLDQTLAIVAEVPIPSKWVQKDPVLSRMQGQPIQLVIGGTLKRPQLDRRAVEQLAAQLLRNAAEQALTGELNKQLDKLFKPR